MLIASYFIIMNLVIAILTDGYRLAKEETVQDKWKKEKKLKLEDALVKAGIPDIPRQNQKPLGISLLVIGFCALFMANFFYYNYIAETVVCFGGLALLLAGGIILANTESQNKKAMEKRVAILEEKRGLN